MSKYQRTKGASWEREVSRRLRSVGFTQAKRHLEFQSEEAAQGRDIDLGDSCQFKIQCKSMANTPSMPAVFKEIEVKEDDIPVVVFKVTGKGEYACFKLEDALVLMAWMERFSGKGSIL